MGRDVIIACDFNSKEEVVSFLSKFQDEKPFVKNRNGTFFTQKDLRSSEQLRRWDIRFSLI